MTSHFRYYPNYSLARMRKDAISHFENNNVDTKGFFEMQKIFLSPAFILDLYPYRPIVSPLHRKRVGATIRVLRLKSLDSCQSSGGPPRHVGLVNSIRRQRSAQILRVNRESIFLHVYQTRS